MSHLTEEDLIAHTFAEDDKDGVEQHLAACAECAMNYAALRSDLAEMEFVKVPARDALHGKRVWESISGSLPAYEGHKWNWLRGGPWMGLSYAAACIALATCTFIGGRLWERREAKTVAGNHTPQKQQSVANPPQRVVVVVRDCAAPGVLVRFAHAEVVEIGTVTHAHLSPNSRRAMTSRWISLVPSPMVHRPESRQ